LALEVEDVAGSGEFEACAANVSVGARGFGSHGNARDVIGGLRCFGIGLGRFDPAPDLPKQIQLIGDMEAHLIDGPFRRGHGLQILFARKLALRQSRGDARGRAAHLLCRFHAGFRAGDIGLGDPQVGIGRQSLAHQVVEHRFLVKLPPCVGDWFARSGTRLDADKGRARCRLLGHGVVWHAVVRTHGLTPRQQRCGDRGRQQDWSKEAIH
jgi:hypothetical protein